MHRSQQSAGMAPQDTNGLRLCTIEEVGGLRRPNGDGPAKQVAT